MNRRYLPTYLNDHLAGATAGLELAKRAASSNEDNEYGAFLGELAHEIAEDRASLVQIMERLDVKQDRFKVSAAFIAEKLGRLKPNAHLTSYSPLSRVVELEALSLGVEGKLAGWQSLRRIADDEPLLDAEELDALIVRAAQQREDLERHRLRAAAEVLA